jgi:hypothetical protein
MVTNLPLRSRLQRSSSFAPLVSGAARRNSKAERTHSGRVGKGKMWLPPRSTSATCPPRCHLWTLKFGLMTGSLKTLPSGQRPSGQSCRRPTTIWSRSDDWQREFSATDLLCSFFNSIFRRARRIHSEEELGSSSSKFCPVAFERSLTVAYPTDATLVVAASSPKHDSFLGPSACLCSP